MNILEQIQEQIEIRKAIIDSLDNDLEYFKREIIKILEKQEAGETATKSLDFINYFYVEKSALGVGHVSAYKDGSMWKKIQSNPPKWKCIRQGKNFTSETSGAKQSITKLIKKVKYCNSTDELLDIVMFNIDRFRDGKGQILPIVKKLKAAGIFHYAKEGGGQTTEPAKPLPVAANVPQNAENVKEETAGGTGGGENNTSGEIKSLIDNIGAILHGTDSEKEKLKQTFFKLADTSDTLKKVGLKGERFVVRYGIIARHKRKDADHNFTEGEWRQICDKINAPVLVTKYGDGFNLYLDVMKNGKHTLVGVDVKSAGKNILVNNVKTAFASKIDKTEKVVLDNRKKGSAPPAMSDEDQSSTYSGERAPKANVQQSAENVKGDGNKADEKSKRRYGTSNIAHINTVVNEKPMNEEKAQKLSKAIYGALVKAVGGTVNFIKKSAIIINNRLYIHKSLLRELRGVL